MIGSLVLLAASIFPSPCRAAAPIPPDAMRYRAELTRNARLVWGLDAPTATFAAQIHQESGWNPAALSRVGAAGVAQFMPATARWWCEINDIAAGDCAPSNPTWALRALTGYDRWLWDRIEQAQDGCERMAMTLSAYNGGLGWVQRDRARAAAAGVDPGRWFGSVEAHNAGRSTANFAENRGYPVRILKVLTPRYAAWGPGACTRTGSGRT